MAKDEKLEWFPFYHNRFIRDTAQWDDLEVGVYIRLLSTQWINGFLINDIERIRKITTQSPEQFKKIWEFIKCKFPKNAKGDLQNPFLEKVRKEQELLMAKKTRAGKDGAEARWGAPLVLPYETETFKNAWELWKAYKKATYRFHYKTKMSEQAALKKVGDISEGKEETAVKVILQAIEYQWQGFFPLKQNYVKKFNSNLTAEGLITSIKSRY